MHINNVEHGWVQRCDVQSFTSHTKDTNLIVIVRNQRSIDLAKTWHGLIRGDGLYQLSIVTSIVCHEIRGKSNVISMIKAAKSEARFHSLLRTV